jgi:hypothetical protein
MFDDLKDVPIPQPRKAPRYKGALVYFVQAKDGGPVKIGKTSGARLRSRLSALQTSSAESLVIRRLVRADGMHDLEAELHQHLAEYRVRGEWFRDEGAVRDLARTHPMFPEVVMVRGRVVSVRGQDLTREEA